MLFPNSLQAGDQIRVIAPARSLAIISQENRQIAEQVLANLGLRLSFGENVMECDEFLSSSIEARIADLHAAFSDPEVKGILTVLGGYNSNQLLSQIDYDLIAANPKILCGYSDITALQNAILARSGLVTYSGPHYSSFAMKKGNEYTIEHFVSCLFDKKPFELKSSHSWSSDTEWFLDQENRTFKENKGCDVISTGEAEGRIVGGNLGTLLLLKGTPYMPALENSILFLEDDAETGGSAVEIDRNLQSIVDLPEFSGVRGIIIGRFEKNSSISLETLKKIVLGKRALRELPVIANADFGHTTPMFTFPIGGTAHMRCDEAESAVTITKH